MSEKPARHFGVCPTCGQLRPVFTGAQIRKLREANGLGVREVARALGVDASFITRVEQGRYRDAPMTKRYLTILQPVTP